MSQRHPNNIKTASVLSQLGQQPIIGRNYVGRLPEKEAADEDEKSVSSSISGSLQDMGNSVSSSMQSMSDSASKSMQSISDAATESLPSWESVDGPLAAGSAAASPFVLPAAQGAIKEMRGASNRAEAITKGTAGAIEGLGAPGRLLQGGINRSDRMPTTLPGAVERLKDSYGLGKGDQYYKNLAQQARNERPDRERLENLFGEDVVLQGSTGTGINVPGESDIDVLIPESSSQKADERFQSILDEHNISPNASDRRPHNVATGEVGGEKMDIVVGSRPKVHDRVEKIREFNNNVSDLEKGRIIDQKAKLDELTGGPYADYERYMNFKRDIDQNYGIPRLG